MYLNTYSDCKGTKNIWYLQLKSGYFFGNKVLPKRLANFKILCSSKTKNQNDILTCKNPKFCYQKRKIGYNLFAKSEKYLYLCTAKKLWTFSSAWHDLCHPLDCYHFGKHRTWVEPASVRHRFNSGSTSTQPLQTWPFFVCRTAIDQTCWTKPERDLS